MPEAEVDVLFGVKNAFYCGLYQKCINECQNLKVSEASLKLERDVFMYRSYTAQSKFAVVLGEIDSSYDPQLQAVKLYTEFLKATGDESKQEDILKVVEDRLKANTDVDNKILPLLTASIYFHMKNTDAALRVLHNTECMEASALGVQILLSMNRVDLAKKELKLMTDLDEDATLTQLAQAWYNMNIGGEKLQDAFYIFQELSEKNGPSPLLLNGQAACLLAQNKLDEAESVLQEANITDSNCAETLINMIVLSQLQGKSDYTRYLSLLKSSHPNHSYVQDLQAKESDFDRVIMQYAPA